MRHLNFDGKRLYEEQMKQYRAYMPSKLPSEQRKELEGLRREIIERKAVNKALSQTLVLTPDNTPQNILSLQTIPNPQNISSSLPIRTVLSPEQFLSSSSRTAPFPDHSSVEHRTDPIRAERAASPNIIDANSLTMQHAVELFELLQAKKLKEAEKSVTVEAQPVAGAPIRAEPLSFLTLGTVEGIVGSTSPDALQEQTSWEGKVEQYIV